MSDTVVHETTKAKVHKVEIVLGDATKDGAFYIKIDGKNIGLKDRTHFETAQDANDAADEIIKLMSKSAPPRKRQ